VRVINGLDLKNMVWRRFRY